MFSNFFICFNKWNEMKSDRAIQIYMYVAMAQLHVIAASFTTEVSKLSFDHVNSRVNQQNWHLIHQTKIISIDIYVACCTLAVLVHCHFYAFEPFDLIPVPIESDAAILDIVGLVFLSLPNLRPCLLIWHNVHLICACRSALSTYPNLYS